MHGPTSSTDGQGNAAARASHARIGSRTRPDGHQQGQGGFALAVVLIALVGLTALGVGGFLMTTSGYTASQNSRTSLEALYLADKGLEQFLATHQGPVPTSPVTYSYASGTAEVTMDTLNRPNHLQSVWRITSEGRHPLPKGGTARRTVQTIAILDGQTFKFPSAFSSATGMTKTGGSGKIWGDDQSNPGECPTAGTDHTNGVATPVSSPYDQKGGTMVPKGSPKDSVLVDSQTELLESTGVDWAAMVAGELLQFDYVVPPDSWPDFSTLPADEWPVVYVDNPGSNFSAGPGHSGRGTLIVRGDLTTGGSFEWRGPVLVGGAYTSDGFQQIEGGIISGFNVLLGESVDQSSIGNGNKNIFYHSCNNMAAMQHTATFVKDPGTWAETY
jgi:Tfp pilus assembly protein PilV